MSYKTTRFKTLIITVKSVFHQCKLHGENFDITLNVVHSYNTNLPGLYLVVILGKTVGYDGGTYSTLL